MNISMSSWHYSLLDFFGLVPYTWRQNLCIYMRRLTLLMLGLSLLAADALFYPYGWYLILTLPAKAQIPWYIIVGIWGWVATNGVLVLITLGLIVWAIDIAWDKYKDSRLAAPYKEPGIVSVYWESLKDKVCIGITYTD